MDLDSTDDCIYQSKFNEEIMDFKDKLTEKGSIEMIEKESKLYSEDKEAMKDILDANGHKIFDYDTLNRDLADIEERLRQTRQSWNKHSRSSIPDISEFGVRKSSSMLDIERKTYSSASSNAELEKYDGEKQGCYSPAVSESLLKWDYGADIGLNQDDSDDMEPITWPVTAEEAQRNEKDALNRKMKQSLSQGSFLASPDPDDKHNLIHKVSEEYKSKNGSLSKHLNSNRRQYHSVSTLSTGKYDDVSARQIMEQAEAAEKRLRERLEAVKAVHLSGKYFPKEVIEDDKKHSAKDEGYFPSESSLKRLSEHSNVQDKDEIIVETLPTAPNKSPVDHVTEFNGSNAADERSRSPTSITNTGRTTTIESTHTLSDYGKAPTFQPEAYGTRTDYQSSDYTGSMYSKRSKDKFVDRGRTVCGIAPELDTISSRETLQITDEKKENSPPRDDDTGNIPFLKDWPSNDTRDGSHNIHSDVVPEESLQLKWDRFKSQKKDDEHDHLFERTTIRSASQYNPPSSHRQYSSATTFTTITNVSPRYDSFATDTLKSPLRDNHSRDHIPGNNDASGDNKEKQSPEKSPPSDETKRGGYRTTETRRIINSRPRRVVGGGGGTGGDQGDDDEDDDDISQTEKRRLRHSGDMKKLKKRFGSGQLDGETTASELEHDDAVKCRQKSGDRGGRCKQFSRMLTDLSRRGATEETIVDVSDRSDSSSVDTMNLMNRMSRLLGKQTKESIRRVDPYIPKQGRVSDRAFDEKPQYQRNLFSNKNNVAKVPESEDGMLVLKHLMLKQKVKWLADCAREEARRRKVKKLQKLIDMYEQGDRVVVPSDLETDTATLMGSDRGSQNDLDSQTDSFSQYDEVTPMDYNHKNTYEQEQPKRSRSKQKLQEQRYSEPSGDKRRREHKSVSKKQYPVSEAWHIPLREINDNGPVDMNSSNWCDRNSDCVDKKRSQQRYRSPCSRAESYCQDKAVNLSVKERVRIKYELEMARQKNSHECQKDLRHLRTGNVKVATSGLSWVVGSSEGGQNDSDKRMSRGNGSENQKEKGNVKSELQLAFENSMEGFISRSRQRQKRIKLAADDRRYESQMNMERAKLFANNGGSCVPKRRPVTQPDPLSATTKSVDRAPRQVWRRSGSTDPRHSRSVKTENLYKPRRRKLSTRDMKVQSARKYQELPEVQAKYVDERRKARIQSNRMRMQLYSEKILQSLLRNRGPWVSEGR